MTTYNLLRQAILARQQVVAEYRGHVREMSPHLLGWKNGREKALLYQFGGGSSSGLDPIGSPTNWRCVFVENLRIIEVRDGQFYTAPNHSKPQTCVGEIDVEVAY